MQNCAENQHDEKKRQDFAFYHTNPHFLRKYYRILVRRSTKIKVNWSAQLVVRQTTQNFAFYHQNSLYFHGDICAVLLFLSIILQVQMIISINVSKRCKISVHKRKHTVYVKKKNHCKISISKILELEDKL